MSRASVGANLLRTVISGPTITAVARTVEAVSVAKAIIGACLEITAGACESWVACTFTIVAVLVEWASSIASTESTVNSHVAVVADAGPVNALAVSVAFVGAG
jgi:hypothetical protein